MGRGRGRPRGRRGGGGSASAPRGRKRQRRAVEEEVEEEEEAVEIGEEMLGEDYCFICKDGGDLRICDFRGCNKAYHPACVGKDSDFLTSDEEFICGCVAQADFFPVLRKTKGFCINCLRLAIMIEKNVDVDSDGERADFNDRETYEFLFKDYWEIVKDKEGLTLDKLEEAYSFLKRGLNCKQADLEKVPDEERHSDSDFLGNSDEGDDELCSPSYSNGSSKKIKSLLKEGKSKKNGYLGWGSEALIEFLASLGKDTSKSLDQFRAAEAVKDYIRQNGLMPKDKKKLVICDDKLKCLFRKSKLKFNRIPSLLKKHITENMTSEDETLNSEDNIDSVSAMTKKDFTANHVSRIPNRTSEINKRCFASLKPGNIKLVYLKRSLVMDLLKEPDTFESKVTGCFVRVKNDPKDYSYLIRKKSHELRQVTGVKRSSEEYKIKGISTGVLLCTFDNDLRISTLSDEDFEEDECDDLRLLAQEGSFKRPTVGDLEEKVKSIHRDIMSHLEDMDKKKLLQEPSERRRLLEEVPQVIPDTEDIKDTELQVTAQDKSVEKNTDAFQGNNGERVISSKLFSEEKSKGPNDARAILKSCSEGKSEGTNLGRGFNLRSFSEEKPKGTDGERTLSLKSCSEEKSKATKKDADCGITGMNVQKGNTEDPGANNAACEIPCAQQDTEATKADANGDTSAMHVQGQSTEAVDVAMIVQVIPIEDDGDENLRQGGGQTAVIDLEADDARDTHRVQHETSNTLRRRGISQRRCVWYYNDPQGDERGPFTMEHLRHWWDGGYFPEEFKVWRRGQSSDSAVFLRDVLQMTR
ncbi:hypothetical protein EJB05_35587 [Eragrostis curvula]|uniref:GYF domain-containing protein n=1 Tax=Eragrostis curvula TaxID=38414 RepID=A0A5J9U7Z9_9POAL|nr:hypothetical protein EJB05_35587 [Eragrostis curvula]